MPQYNIAIIGEAYDAEEAQWKKPFIGPAGKQLDSLLEDAGIERSSCFISNVFNLHPPGNKLETLCCEKDSPLRAPGLKPLIPGKYLRQEFGGEISRLIRELEETRPNLAILLGNTAAWALLESSGINKIRGTCCYSTRLPWLKCLPTYPPAAVLREYSLRHVTVLDFIKAKREGEFGELRRPARTVLVAESIEDIRSFKANDLDRAARISFDIETASGQITCIGFSSCVERALVIPFVDIRRPGGNYWETLGHELDAWDLVAEILRLPCPKLGQNVLYDIQYLWMAYGIPTLGPIEDTMLLHHALQPESEKGLGFLGSVYTNETAWKTERPRGEHSIKKEE